MPKLNMPACWLSCAVLAGCTSLSNPAPPLQAACPQLPPPPASVMVKRAPNFQQRLLDFLSERPKEPTRSQDSLQPVKP